jgi:hypothetical protein
MIAIAGEIWMPGLTYNRRNLLAGTAVFAAGSLVSSPIWSGERRKSQVVGALPLDKVRLLPSPFKTAVDVNEKYLVSLNADRFLHNFRKGAGLTPKAEGYGGWENDTIAGHSLGHYLSAIALMHAQTGNADLCARAGYIVDELALIQGAQGDGYVAGFTRKRSDGTVVDGKEIFPEIMAGEYPLGGLRPQRLLGAAL